MGTHNKPRCRACQHPKGPRIIGLRNRGTGNLDKRTCACHCHAEKETTR